MKKILFFILTIPLITMSQNILRGKVVDDNFTPLSNATVHWMNTNIGATTNENGEFQIPKYKNQNLIISFIGFKADTIQIETSTNSIIRALEKDNNLNTVELIENFQSAYIDKEKAIKIEVITEKELTKAACCELAGCFETQLSVESKTTNIITNTKELSVLGLSGVYNQILIDGFPLVYGLNYTYGISAIPGTLIKNIYISQGLASVLQGHESISGQINIQLKEYSSKENLLINRYYNSFGVKQFNINYNYRIQKWKGISSMHITQPGHRIDKNNDGFLDLPLTSKYSFYHKWIYDQKDSKIYSSITLRSLNEERIGGQKEFEPSRHKGTADIYGQVINFGQFEILNKTSYKINENSSIALETAISDHNQKSFFGIKKYLANQTILHFKLFQVLNWRNHKLTSGFNYKEAMLEEMITHYDVLTYPYALMLKIEKIPGLFIENNFNWNNKNISLITGIRVDHHNEYGLLITPRALLKKNINENTFLRASVGSGWRTVNIFSENINLLGSNKDIAISNDLQPEKAFNYGVNLVHAVYREKSEFQLLIDFYSTIFSNQIHPDYYHINHNTIHIDNFTAKSKSNSFQFELGMEFFKAIGIKIAYNYLDVFQIRNNQKHQLPFTSKHHILNTISYQPIGKNWQFDMNLHWFGKKKLIYNEENQIDYSESSYSEPYSLLNVQLTKKIKKLDIYMGAENILNFQQNDPIISPQKPFSVDFDAANGVWGPTKGIELYIGLRLKL